MTHDAPIDLPVDLSAPWHGYRGDVIVGPPAIRPRGLTLAISREAGARGGSIARRVEQELGWQYFDADALDFLIQDDSARRELMQDLPPQAKEWAECRLTELTHGRTAAFEPDVIEVMRLMLTLGARGEVILVGRGAGFVLPRETTLHVRVVATEQKRIAYLSDWLRMTPDEASHELHSRDDNRQRFLKDLGVTHPSEATSYDLILNSDRLGEELAASIIVHTVRARMHAAEHPLSPETA